MQTKTKLLNRRRINQKLENIFLYPLSIVHAPIGYGKTTAVSQFLNQYAGTADLVWVSLAGSGGSVEYLWNHLVENIQGSDLRHTLKKMGYSYDELKRANLVDLLIDYEYKRPAVLVLDDFQVINDPGVFALIKLVVQEHIKNMHIVLITRDLSKLDAAGLYQKQLCFTLTEKSLKFTGEEIQRYFNMVGCMLSEDDVEKIYSYTEGWVSMVYVLLKGVQRGLPVGKSDTINDIIEQNLYNTLSGKARETLCRLSFLETFTISMALYVLDDPEAGYVLQTLIKQNTFVVYNEFDKSYKIRNLLQEFFMLRAKFLNIDFQPLYKRAGEWYLRERQYGRAFEYLYQAGEIEMILAEFNRENTPDIQFTQFRQLFHVFDTLTQEQCLKYPIAYLQYIRIRAMGTEPGAPGRCWDDLDTMERYIRGSSLNDGYKRFLLGEVNVVRTFVVYNDLEAMVRCNEKAMEYFSGGCSCIVTRRKEFTFGSPHLLYGYYKEKGRLQHTAEYLAQHSESLTAPIDGCGMGCDSVALAEYTLETGDFDHVELHAYKAMYKAKAAKQTCLMICAKFALARLEILCSTSERDPQMMESLREEVLKENNPVLNSTFALCDGYLNACLGRGGEIAEWIRSGDLSGASFLRQGMPFYHTVHAKAVMLSGDAIRLEAVCEMALREFAPYQNQLGLLHNAVYMAVAQKQLHGEEAGCAALCRALEIGQADGIVLPFAENAVYILDMLEKISDQNVFEAAYMNRVLFCAQEYQKRVERLNFSKVVLTAREKEILGLLERGCKHEEIGERLFISVTTVRYHIKNIYQKLEVNNKVLAIKKAQELKLL